MIIVRLGHRISQGRLELRDSDTKEGFKLDFEGIHSIVDGTIYGFAKPSG